jgi:hypothetical protein
MLILARSRRRDPNAGFARTFVQQMEDVMGDCLDRGVRVVSNAGGLAPRACADAVHVVAERLGLNPVIAYVEGDDLLPRLGALRADGHRFENLDTAAELGDEPVLSANAYVGGWGIAAALARGADIVITGRTTDAALALGPAAWWHGWRPDDWDRLAGAVVAGHVIECGPQATGGNYSFFEEIPGAQRPGFPVAEIFADGSSVITKHANHGGAVTVGTITAQLLYEIGSPAYANPDVIARFDTIRLEQACGDRVRITGVRGEPPPSTLKVCINLEGGHRTTVTSMLTGLDIDKKAELLEQGLWASVPGGRDAYDSVDVELIRSDHDDAATNEQAVAQLRITVKDSDERKLGRTLSAALTELSLSSYPGFFVGPSTTQSYGVHWPTSIPVELVCQEVFVGDQRMILCPQTSDEAAAVVAPIIHAVTAVPTGPTTRAPLGRLVGARSGDKGGNANVGVWARSDDAYAWLDGFLTTECFKSLVVPHLKLEIERHSLPNLRAVNFVVRGLLGNGVAACTRLDPQAKGLGEYLRSKIIDIPDALLEPR